MSLFNINDIKMAYSLLKMQLRDRYLGSKLGMLWAVIQPLLLMGTYTFVFGFVLESKIPGSTRSLDFVIWLLCGVAPWLAVSEGLTSTANSVVSSSSLVKNIVFKAELLPITATVLSFISMVVGLVLLGVLLLTTGTNFSVHILWLVIIIPLHFLFISGLGFFLASVTVFFRDITQILGTVLMLLLFFTPIFYSIEQMPSLIQKVTLLNPFYQIVSPYRMVILGQQTPDMLGLVYLALLDGVLWYVGLRFFRICKPHFESFL